ncbi:MAG: hypothetical protein ACLVB5_03090 [Christensenellales bacterium]
MNRRPSQSRTGFDSFSPQHTAHFKAAQPGGEFFDSKPRASLGRRLLLALLLMTLIALAVNLAVNQFVRSPASPCRSGGWIPRSRATPCCKFPTSRARPTARIRR